MKKDMLRKLAAIMAVVMLLVTVAVADTYVSDPLRISSYVTAKEDKAADSEEDAAEESEEEPGEEPIEEPIIEESEAAAEELDLGSLNAELEGEAVAGGTVQLEIKLSAANAAGTPLKAFTVAADTDLELDAYRTNASGSANALRVAGAVAENGKVMLGEEELEIILNVKLPEAAGEETVTFTVLDSTGNEIDAGKKCEVKLNVVEAEEQPEIDLGLDIEGNYTDPADGDTIKLTAFISGLEEGSYKVKWQMSDGEDEWTDIDGAEGLSYTFTVGEENRGRSMRYLVDIL